MPLTFLLVSISLQTCIHLKVVGKKQQKSLPGKKLHNKSCSNRVGAAALIERMTTRPTQNRTHVHLA